ncbi:MAG TPA: hypothetical protein VHY76_07995 [Acetobacteraceae bacterium]|nr:hypothetical protein [Acetobacteraceae bacterium]
MTRALGLLSLLVLAACAASLSDGHYAGTVTPAGMSGPPVPAMLCQGVTRGGLDIAGSHFAFVPNEGTIILHGTITPSGALAATRALPGADRRTYTVRFTGQLRSHAITGQLVTPECHAAVALARE